MLRPENAWIWLVGIIMCVGLASVACTGDDPADLEADDFADADGDFDEGDTAADPGGAVGGSGGQGGTSDKPSTDTDPSFCTKLEGSQIGEPGITVQAGAVTVTVSDWREKTDEPGEYIGFEYKTSGGMVWFGAKAGVEIFYHWGAKSWVNPHIEEGGEIKGLSWIIFCEDDGAWIENCPNADGENPDAFDDDDDEGGAGGDAPGGSSGLPDGSNGTGDADGDGIPDAEDGVEGDGPGGSGSSGLPDGSNGTGDADGDGIPDAEDTVDGPNPEGTDDDCDTCEMNDVGTDGDTDTVVVV